MSKALYGFVGGPDPRLLAEIVALRARVRELESEVAMLRSGAAGELRDDAIDLDLFVQDPALV